MVEMRLRASSSVCIRGDSGKLPRIWMSLSVKSIASCGCIEIHGLAIQARGGSAKQERRPWGGLLFVTYARDTKVLDGRYPVTCLPTRQNI